MRDQSSRMSKDGKTMPGGVLTSWLELHMAERGESWDKPSQETFPP